MNQPTIQIDPFMRLPEVQAATGLKTSAIYELIAKDEFPRPLALTKRAVGWRASDIKAWCDSRPTKHAEAA